MPGMGKCHFPISTQKSDAQAFFDQGVAQLHSFLYFEAERSFRTVAKLDPKAAMAYWGMAMANTNNPKRAKGFLKDARKLAAKLSRRETLYLEALEAAYKEGAGTKEQHKGWLEGLESVVQEFPDDLDARAWLAMVSWQNYEEPASRKSIDIVIDSVLHTEPLHPGAHHYRIHLWDSSKPIRAEKSAGLYARTAPGIAHAWHMPGHTYTNLKRYADAAYQQEGSARVDHAYMLRDRVMPFEIHNYAHNNQWLCTSLSHIGRVQDALAVARNLVEQPRDPNLNGPNDGGSAQRAGRLRWSQLLARYELWDTLIESTQPAGIDWSDIGPEKLERAYSLGLAYAAKKDAKQLADQIAALHKLAREEAGKSKKPADAASTKPPYEAASPATRSALAELEGWDHLLKGEIGPAFDQFARATQMRPETLARAHIAARNCGLAESTAKKAVEQNPEQLPPLATLVEILHEVGKDKESQQAYRKLIPLARSADLDSPIMKRLQTLAAAWKRDKVTPEIPSLGTPTTQGSDEATVRREELAALGPLVWTPSPAEPFVKPDSKGKNWKLADQKGKNVLLLFFLGGKCAHCLQQLQLFGKQDAALAKLNVTTIAISTDGRKETEELLANKDGISFPMPFLPDAELDLFRRYRAYDDFEDHPLHGVFLIDARGDVRYERVSAEPFLDVDFIKSEAARINRILARKP
jgi:peroxiredoxin